METPSAERKALAELLMTLQRLPHEPGAAVAAIQAAAVRAAKILAAG